MSRVGTVGPIASASRPSPRSSSVSVIAKVSADCRSVSTTVEDHILKTAEHGAEDPKRVREPRSATPAAARGGAKERSIGGVESEDGRQNRPEDGARRPRSHGNDRGHEDAVAHQPTHGRTVLPAVGFGEHPWQHAQHAQVDHRGVADELTGREPSPHERVPSARRVRGTSTRPEAIANP